jgi:triphosphoribosyl-dephospho-CoA synthetase
LFFWKIAKNFVKEELPKKMAAFKVLGQKEDQFKLYQRINYSEKIIAGLEQEVVEAHNPTFGKLFKWLTLAIATRKGDIIYRKAHSKKAREHREKCQEQLNERTEAKAKAIEDAMEQFNTDHAADFEAY